MKQVDVYLDTGVTVHVPDELDTSTEEGIAVVKQLAIAKFKLFLDGIFDIHIGGEYDLP